MTLTQKPSEYFRRQVYVTFMDDKVGISTLNFVGKDNWMFASDYPHSVSTWPESRKYIDSQMSGLASSGREKLLAGNAVRLYQLSER